MPKYSHRTDPFILYQNAVQSPEGDIQLIDRTYRKIFGRPARSFREDFCGTALLSCEWVRLGKDRTAIGVDLDAPTLRWGRKHNLSTLTEDEQMRIELVRANVLDLARPKVDVLAALNFSWWVFKTRAQMLAYVRNAYRSLNRNGMLFMDIWGGTESQTEHTDRRRIAGGYTYVWEQRSFDPISFHTDCRIHFEFPNGKKLRNAFVYDWRMWTLPELKDIFAEVGFKDIHVLWETSDANGRGTGIYRRTEKASEEESWIACVVGRT